MALATGANRPETTTRDRSQREASTTTAERNTPESLCQRLSRIIDQRTAGRVHALEVCPCAATGGLEVRGVVGSHYVRQLVLAAVLEALGQEGLSIVRIEVSVRRPQST